ncbi:MAG: riboflavin biosynthesis protein RibF [Christensenellales bacterium]|jgi:riboflavin kinase/FMN adenylyltransferase
MQKISAVVALGMFDGVHMGHRKLLFEAKRMAAELNAVPVAHTFSNNPQSLFRDPPPVLTLPEEKKELIESLGIMVDMVPFTQEIAQTAPEAFLDMLSEKFELKGVVAGFNYCFGKGRTGDAAFLVNEGKRRGFAVSILEPVIFRDKPVSSTRIRHAILRGDIACANEMLAAPLFYTGIVQPRKHIGHALGYPTANLIPEGKILPPFGVYAAIAEYDGISRDAAINIGIRPTVDKSEDPVVTVESHLIGHSGEELYGRRMTVRIIAFIRPEYRFPTREALAEQIGKDLITTKNALLAYRTK